MSAQQASFATSLPADAASAESGPIVKRADELPPTLLGRYALFGQIGAGGMGVVHLGRLLGSAGFERAVAIKRIHPSLGHDRKFVTMFRQELRLLARVRHQNVISALDVVEADEDLLLVMEYVHGESLASLLQRAREAGQPLPIELAVTIACGVLRGLHAAHTATSAAGQPLGIIHRDVSPHNVLVGCDGIARIVDFGVAKSVSSRGMTRVGELRGKPGYVSPEQIGSEGVSRRADVYALSVVLWEMLAFQRLFSGRSLPETIEDVLAGNIPALESVLGHAFPVRLEAIIRKGLSRNPEARYETARDMALALEAEVKLVSLEDVGEWVAETASVSLADRARQLDWAENCPLGDGEVTEITQAPFEAVAEPVTKLQSFDGPEMTTRELPLSALGVPTLASPPPTQASTSPASKTGRRVLIGTAVTALLFGATQLDLFSDSPAPTTRHTAAVSLTAPTPPTDMRPQSDAPVQVDSPPHAEPAPDHRALTRGPATQNIPTIAASALRLERPSAPKLSSIAPPSTPPRPTSPSVAKTTPRTPTLAAPRSAPKAKVVSEDGF